MRIIFVVDYDGDFFRVNIYIVCKGQNISKGVGKASEEVNSKLLRNQIQMTSERSKVNSAEDSFFIITPFYL